MNSRQIPKYIKDCINGYCKKHTLCSIPLSLQIIIALYFTIHIQQNLFRVQFKYQQSYISRLLSKGAFIRNSNNSISLTQTLTSISSTFIISNKCYKAVLHLGKTMDINILLSKSIVKIDEEILQIEETKSNSQYKIDTNSKNNEVEITIKMNRKTPCSCLNTDGNVELWIKQNKTNAYDTGYVQVSLLDSFNYNNDETVSIETFDTNQIDVISNQNTNLPCDEFGFGRQCCFWAAYEPSTTV